MDILCGGDFGRQFLWPQISIRTVVSLVAKDIVGNFGYRWWHLGYHGGEDNPMMCQREGYKKGRQGTKTGLNVPCPFFQNGAKHEIPAKCALHPLLLDGARGSGGITKVESPEKSEDSTWVAPSDILSNLFLEDLDRIWELKKWIPDPCNPYLHYLKQDQKEENMP